MKYRIKNITRFALLAVMTAVGVTTATAGTEVAQRLYDTSAISIGTVTGGDGNEYSTIEWSGMGQTAEVGAPTLPVEYIRFIVPVYTNNFRAKITGQGRLVSRTLPYDLYPAQKPAMTVSDTPGSFTSPAPEAYSMTHSIRAEVVEEGFIDGCNHIVTVAVYPMAYTATSGTINAPRSLNVTLEYDECTASNLKDIPLFPPMQTQHIELDSLVVNKDKTSNIQYAPIAPSINMDTERECYYIITPSNLKDAFEDLARWKRQKGYTVHVKTIEDIYAQYQPGTTHSCSLNGNSHNVEMVDSAASLRTFLQDEYTKNGVFFCLLAGDWTTSMPIRKVYTGLDNGSVDDPYAPTDDYFSDLTSKWNLVIDPNTDFYYEDIDHISYTPDIYVGRLLCRTKQDIYNYINKLLIYEANPGRGDNDYLDNAFFFEQNWKLLGHSQIVRNICKFNHIELYPTSDYTKNDAFPKGSDVINQMSISGFSSWHGHGSPYGISTCVYSTWRDYQVIADISYKPLFEAESYPDDEGNSLTELKNINHPGVVYSTSCVNAPFDVYTKYNGDKYNLPCFAACYTGNENGGVAFLGYTRPSYICYSPGVEKIFVENIQKYKKIGVAESLSKSSSEDQYTRLIQSLIGEPEFEIWLGKPSSLYNIVSIEGNLFNCGSTQNVRPFYITTYVDGGSAVTKMQLSGYVDLGTFTTEYCVSAWRSGFLPFIRLMAETGSIESDDRAYIVRDAVIGQGDKSNSYNVKSQGKLSIQALDRIDTYKGMTIENGGTLTLKCDRTIYLNGGTVKNGGKLIVQAQNVVFGDSFDVNKGGILEIISNK